MVRPTSAKRNQPQPRPQSPLAPTEFPIIQYASLLGTSTLFLLFSILYLPRSSLWLLGPLTPTHTSSSDRPQHTFLDPLTAHPTYTLSWICAGASVITIWWAGWVRMWYNREKNTYVSDTTKRVQAKILSIRNAVIATLAGTLAYYVLTVAFGGPVLSHDCSSISFSALLAILTIYTPVYALPLPHFTVFGYSSSLEEKPDSVASLVDKLNWTRLFSELSPQSFSERVIVYPVMGAFVGCWTGVLPLALDWDRPWQAWPLLPAYGVVIGYILGSGYCFISITWETLVEEGKKAKDA